MKTKQYKRQSGFTLLELIVVVAVLGLITNLATEFVAQNVNQQRFDTTKDRLEKIQYAIIGDDTRTVNGQPDLVGFVHDMGRVPQDLDELVTEPTDCDPNTSGNQLCSKSYSSTLNRTIGWRGPYISKETTDNDGWGNSWNYGVTANVVTIESFGLDGSAGSTASYEGDESISIDDDDYLVTATVEIKLTDNIGMCVDIDNSQILQSTFTTELSCETASHKWVAVPASESCSDTDYTDQTSCTNNSQTWGLIPRLCDSGNRFNYPDRATCEAATGVWNNTSNLCAQITYVKDGSRAVMTSNERYDYDTGTGSFTFPNAAPIGSINIQLVEYDYETTSCGSSAITNSSENTIIYARRNINSFTF